MHQSFGEKLRRLRKTHHFLRDETEGLARHGPTEAEALGRLRDKARSCQEQAHSLLVTMAYQEAPEPLQKEAEDLVQAFVEALSQIDALLATGKRGT